MKSFFVFLMVVCASALAGGPHSTPPSGGNKTGEDLVTSRRDAALKQIAERLGIDIDWSNACTSLTREAESYKEADYSHPQLYFRCLANRLDDQFFIARNLLSGQKDRITDGIIESGNYKFGKTSSDPLPSPPPKPPGDTLQKEYAEISKRYQIVVNSRKNDPKLKLKPADHELTYRYMVNVYHGFLVSYLEKLSAGSAKGAAGEKDEVCGGLTPSQCARVSVELDKFFESLRRDCLKGEGEGMFPKYPKLGELPTGTHACATRTRLALHAERLEKYLETSNDPESEHADLEKIHALLGHPRPTAKTLEERAENAKQRLAIFKALCTKDDKILTDSSHVPVVVQDKDGGTLDCGREAHALSKELEALGIGNGEGECSKDEQERKNDSCAAEMVCNAMRSAMNWATGPLGPIVKSFVGFDKVLEEKAPKYAKCLKNNQTDCFTALVSGIVNNLWSTIKGLWDLAKLAVNGVKDLVVSGWNWLFNIEDKSSDAAQAAATQSPGAIKLFLTDPLKFISETAKAIYEQATKFIREDFMCAEWSGTPHASTCTKPATSWACADCNQRTNAICGVVGVLASEIISAYFTGGASTAIGKGAAVVGSKLAVAGSKVARAGAALAKAIPAMTKVGKATALAGKGLSVAARAAIKALVESPVAKAVVAVGKATGGAAVEGGKIAARLASPVTGAVAASGKFVGRLLVPVGNAAMVAGKTLTWPIRKYFTLMDEAFNLGGQHAAHASAALGKYLEKSNLVSRFIPKSQASALAQEALGGTTLNLAQRRAAARAAAHGDGKLTAEILAEKAKMLIEGKVAKNTEEALKILEKWYGKEAKGAGAASKAGSVAGVELDEIRGALDKAQKARPKLPVYGDAEARAAAAEELLGKKLSKKQKEALERAHEVGTGQPGRDGGPASHYNYTDEQLKEKLRILRDAGISKEDRHALLRAGIAGRGPDLPIVPKGYGITKTMAEQAERAEEIIKRLNVCGGGRHCKSPTEKIAALDLAIAREAKSGKGGKLAELRQARDDLTKAWDEAERMHNQLLAMNRSRTFPYGFASQAEWDHFRKSFLNELRKRLGQPGNSQIEAHLGGSAIEGLSYMPKEGGIMRKPFGAASDLDILIVVPEKQFKKLFPKGLEEFVEQGDRLSFALDMDKLSAALAKSGMPETQLRNLKHFLEQQQKTIGGRKISLKFSVEQPVNGPTGKFVPLGG